MSVTEKWRSKIYKIEKHGKSFLYHRYGQELNAKHCLRSFLNLTVMHQNTHIQIKQCLHCQTFQHSFWEFETFLAILVLVWIETIYLVCLHFLHTLKFSDNTKIVMLNGSLIFLKLDLSFCRFMLPFIILVMVCSKGRRYYRMPPKWTISRPSWSKIYLTGRSRLHRDQ